MADISGLGFDANKVQPNDAFDPLPAGEYDAVIVASERKKTNAGTGEYIKLQLQILSGQFQNRRLFDNLNLWNPNDKTVQIARGTLSSICRAVNVLTPNDTSELHNKPLRIKVTVKDDPEYGPGNEIKAYKPRQAAPQHVTPASAPVSVPATQQEQRAEPWPW
jgi:hypothetical protein